MDTGQMVDWTTAGRVFLSRRHFLRGAGALAAGAFLTGCGTGGPTPPSRPTTGTDELNDPWTSYESITGYNNFYEFSLEKDDVASLAKRFKTRPWTVQVGGLVNKPRTYAVDDLLTLFPQEERTYRLRCVEGWSMVIPWKGFSLAKLLKEVDPLSKANYVRFEALFDPQQMPGQKSSVLHWPYVEGLRLDEALHPLTILASGIADKPLAPQNGAPLRMVVPWKYGFKSIKSIVKIDLVEEMPTTTWAMASPQEYGFYANVNPDVPHPRWPQSSERRIGESSRRKTLPFNGYGNDASPLYEGMDLRKYF